MRPGWTIAPAALLLLAACKQKPAQHTDESAHQGDTVHDHGDAGERALIHVDPEMLRDLRITTAPAEARPGGEAVTVLGEVGVNEDRYAEVASPVAAQVTAVKAGPGDHVRAGQPLVELHSPELGKAKADLAAGEARAAVARKTVERKRALAQDGIVAPREVQEAEAQLAATEGEVAAARAQLSAIGVGVSGSGEARFVLKSPVDGTVIDRSAVVGRAAEPAQPLFRVGDLSRVWLTVQGFERDAVRVRVGAEAQVTMTALPGKSFVARVALVGARVDPTSRTIPIRLELDNADGALRPGMSATAFIPVGEKSATMTTVPAAALQRLDDGWYVFLPSQEEGAFERREVGRGRTLGGEIEILSGLEPGERVVVNGAFLLKAEIDKAAGEGEHHEH